MIFANSPFENCAGRNSRYGLGGARIKHAVRYVRYYPNSGHLRCNPMSALCQKRKSCNLFDHFIGTREQGHRYLYPSCPGSPEIYHQLEFCRLLNRKSCRVCTFENSIDITRGASEEVHFIRPIGDKPAIRCEITEIIDRRQTILGDKLDDLLAMHDVVTVRQHEKPTIRFTSDLPNNVLNVGFVMNLSGN